MSVALAYVIASRKNILPFACASNNLINANMNGEYSIVKNVIATSITVTSSFLNIIYANVYNIRQGSATRTTFKTQSVGTLPSKGIIRQLKYPTKGIG